MPPDDAAQQAFWEIMRFFGPRLRLYELRPLLRQLVEDEQYAQAHFLAQLCDLQRTPPEAAPAPAPAPGTTPGTTHAPAPGMTPTDAAPGWLYTPDGPRHGPPGRERPAPGHLNWRRETRAPPP